LETDQIKSNHISSEKPSSFKATSHCAAFSQALIAALQAIVSLAGPRDQEGSGDSNGSLTEDSGVLVGEFIFLHLLTVGVFMFVFLPFHSHLVLGTQKIHLRQKFSGIR